MNMDPLAETNYWANPVDKLIDELKSSSNGLSANSAQDRLGEYGRNELKKHRKTAPLLLFLSQFKSPLVLILVFAAAISVITGEIIDASIILAIVVASSVLGFIQEYGASNAIEKLRSTVTLKVNLLRDGKPCSILAEEVVPGDIVLLSAGSIIPADGVVIQADDFFVNQAILTGETYPAEKKVGVVAENASLSDRTNCVFMGTNVRSGTARVLAVETGKSTEFGKIAEKLNLRPPETEFERGIRKFGNLLTQVMLLMMLVVFAINVILKKPAIDSLLFSVALAVGLAPNCCLPSSVLRYPKVRKRWQKKGLSCASLQQSRISGRWMCCVRIKQARSRWDW